MVDDPPPHLAQTKMRLDSQAALARELLDRHGDTPAAAAAFVEEITRWTREGAGLAADVFEVGAPVDQLWQGLRRYWRKRAEAAPA
jgi:hypothetical protein